MGVAREEREERKGEGPSSFSSSCRMRCVACVCVRGYVWYLVYIPTPALLSVLFDRAQRWLCCLAVESSTCQ